jgi:hypothetical protein
MVMSYAHEKARVAVGTNVALSGALRASCRAWQALNGGTLHVLVVAFETGTASLKSKSMSYAGRVSANLAVGDIACDAYGLRDHVPVSARLTLSIWSALAAHVHTRCGDHVGAWNTGVLFAIEGVI